MVLTYGAWVLMRKRRVVKVIVYHLPGDTYFEDFRRGMVRACDQENLALDYVTLANDIKGMEHIMRDMIVNDRSADYYVCRIPSEAIAQALLSKGKPIASVMSVNGVIKRSDLVVDVASVNSIRANAGEVVLVHDPNPTSSSSFVVQTTPELCLETVMGIRNTISRVLIASESLASRPILDGLHAMGLHVRVGRMGFDGYAHAKRTIASFVRYKPYASDTVVYTHKD